VRLAVYFDVKPDSACLIIQRGRPFGRMRYVWKRYDFIKSSSARVMNCYRAAHQSRSNTSRDSNLKIETPGWNSNCFGPATIYKIHSISARERGRTQVTTRIRYKNQSIYNNIHQIPPLCSLALSSPLSLSLSLSLQLSCSVSPVTEIQRPARNDPSRIINAVIFIHSSFACKCWSFTSLSNCNYVVTQSQTV